MSTSDVASGADIGNVLEISVTSSDPEVAADVANLYAQEFVDWRVERERARIDAAETVISQKLKEFVTEAQRASSDFFILSERLRDLEILSATATGNFDFVIPASTPSAPYAPQPMRSAMMAGGPGALSSAWATRCCARSSTRACAATARSAR